MNIRRAVEKDIPGMLSLLRQVGQGHHELRPDIFRPVTLKYDHDDVLRIMRSVGFGDIQVVSDPGGIPRVVFGTLCENV